MADLTRQKIHPCYFKVFPCGYRIHIVVEEPVEDIGSIKLPDSVRDAAANKMGLGYIMAVGPLAGETVPGSMQGVLSQSPEDLLGLHVVISAHAGVPLLLSFDREYPAIILMLDTRNVQAVDNDLTPLKYRGSE